MAVAARPAAARLAAAARGRPQLLAAMGAVAIAFSSILVRLADVAPATAAVFRCAYALPVLGVLAWYERRRLGPRSRRATTLGVLAGLLFAVDLVTWHHAIDAVGAGLATVLANLQVALVPLLAWVILDERPGRRVLATLPVVVAGIALISGVLEDGAYGADPVAGAVFGVAAGLSYAGFLLLLRHGAAGGRRLAGPLFEVTLVAAVASAIAGPASGGVDLVPSWPAHAWLVTLALTSQVLGWLLITTSLPRLASSTGSLLLTVQPVGSVLLGALLLGEAPSGLQLAGVALVLAGVLAVTSSAGRGARHAQRPGDQPPV
jgi:drug/metabolite transporter (DMT)-like permease